MALPFTAADFDAIAAVHGVPVSVQHRATSTTDTLGEPVYANSGSPVVITGIVQDVSTNDQKRFAGLWMYGDQVLFTKAADGAIVPQDRLTIDGKLWQIVTETTEATGGVVIYREYLIRRTSSG